MMCEEGRLLFFSIFPLYLFWFLAFQIQGKDYPLAAASKQRLKVRSLVADVFEGLATAAYTSGTLFDGNFFQQVANWLCLLSGYVAKKEKLKEKEIHLFHFTKAVLFHSRRFLSVFVRSPARSLRHSSTVALMGFGRGLCVALGEISKFLDASEQVATSRKRGAPTSAVAAANQDERKQQQEDIRAMISEAFSA
jgi:hypothetical protein